MGTVNLSPGVVMYGSIKGFDDGEVVMALVHDQVLSKA